MAFMAAKLAFDLGPLLEAAGKLAAEAEVVVDATAVTILDHAQANAPVDTSSLRESGYVVTAIESGYSAAAAAAQGVNPKAVILPEVDKPEPLHAVVAFAADHAVFQEYGTSRMAAHPFLTPAAEGERAAFVDAMKAIVG